MLSFSSSKVECSVSVPLTNEAFFQETCSTEISSWEFMELRCDIVAVHTQQEESIDQNPHKHCRENPKQKPPERYLALHRYHQILGFPIGVADDPMFALEARASRKGTNSVSTTQDVSLVNSALEMAETKQILNSKSLAPLLFQASNFPRYLNMSALSRYTLTTIVPNRSPRMGRSIAA
nr:Os03g0147550 [Ipomoea batatas]